MELGIKKLALKVEAGTKLSPEQDIKLDIARSVAEKGIEAIYRAKGKPFPKIYWVETPLAGAELVAKLLGNITSKDALSLVNYGYHEATWLAFYEAIGKLKGDFIKGLVTTTQSTGWWWSLDEAVVMCERFSKINRDSLGRLHSLTDQAVGFQNGEGYYVIHGIDVPENFIVSPLSITDSDINNPIYASIKPTLQALQGGKRNELLKAEKNLTDNSVDKS